jgi:nicotinamidase-related amidase
MKGKIFIALLLIALMIPFAAYAGMINLGASGDLIKGPQVKYKAEDANISINWIAGTHYNINPKKTALLVIDPQRVYSDPFTPVFWWEAGQMNAPDPVAFFSALGTANQNSPLHCDQYNEAWSNIVEIATACASKDIPVFVIKHVYNADGSNCGRLCDFDPLGSICNDDTCWVKAWMLWNEAVPTSPLDPRVQTELVPALGGDNYYYAEKSTYSSFVKPVAEKLKDLGVDTVIVTGYMTQYCSVTATRHGHDLGYKMINVKDANDGPVLEEVLSGVKENNIVPFYMSIPVADVMDTDTLVNLIQNAN